jgi:uncharacterized protein (DUF433 family)
MPPSYLPGALVIDQDMISVHFSNMNSVATLPDVFSQDAEVMSGALVFRRTRIPAQAFFDHLDHGGTVDQFREWYDGVSRDQLNAALAVRSSFHAVLQS